MSNNTHIINNGTKPSFGTKKDLLDIIDALPGGVPWLREEITLKGDLKDMDGNFLTEELEIWYRDLVECMKELLGNPVFRDVLTYKPLCSQLDEEGRKERRNERILIFFSQWEWWSIF